MVVLQAMRANRNSIFACYRYTWGKQLGTPRGLHAAITMAAATAEEHLAPFFLSACGVKSPEVPRMRRFMDSWEKAKEFFDEQAKADSAGPSKGL